MQLTIAHDVNGLQEALLRPLREGKRIALVPTMGALHAGHMSLIRLAKEQAEMVVVSIFVNPKQFGQNEDFNKYPRNLDDDLKKIDQSGGHVVYAPTPDEIYPPGFATSVSPGALGTMLEGHSRPGHFDGVATVVTKLLLRVMPHVAIFGEKDYQQLCVIRRIVADLDIPIEIVGAPIVREENGLAMSSRNAYLSEEERKVAPKLHAVMTQVAVGLQSGAPVKSVLQQGLSALKSAGFKPDYLELRDMDTLEATDQLPGRLLAAAILGQTRLIDNIAVK